MYMTSYLRETVSMPLQCIAFPIPFRKVFNLWSVKNYGTIFGIQFFNRVEVSPTFLSLTFASHSCGQIVILIMSGRFVNRNKITYRNVEGTEQLSKRQRIYICKCIPYKYWSISDRSLVCQCSYVHLHGLEELQDSDHPHPRRGLTKTG